MPHVIRLRHAMLNKSKPLLSPGVFTHGPAAAAVCKLWKMFHLLHCVLRCLLLRTLLCEWGLAHPVGRVLSTHATVVQFGLLYLSPASERIASVFLGGGAGRSDGVAALT